MRSDGLVVARFFLCATAMVLMTTPSIAQTIVFEDVSPNLSDTDAADPDGATGGRVNGTAIQAGNNQVMYAATEWGGLYQSTNGGLVWSHLPGHHPTATWDIEIDPGSPTRLVATSFYDGRVTAQSGINVSTDGGATWTHPPTSVPPADLCNNALDQTELSAMGIAIDPLDNTNVYIGTSCGLAISNDSGVSWMLVDPTGPDSATRIWDVLAQGGGRVHICGDDGHLRSDDGGSTWVTGSGLPSGRCQMAASPDESYVLFAAVGTSIYETDNANSATPTWAQTRTNQSPQGRIPFVETNQRTDAGVTGDFDLWFGDVSLWRVGCTTPVFPNPGGSPRCGTGNNPPWAGPFTRSAGGHDDTGGLLFDSEVAIDACPLILASDGGVYYNTDSTADCHNPNWEQPDVSPHALWPWSMSGVAQPGVEDEDLYFGNQDNGLFGTINIGSLAPDWHNEVCCDGFDTSGDPTGGLFTVCCGNPRATFLFRTDPGFQNGVEVNTYPPGGLLATFRSADSIVPLGGTSYAVMTRNCTPPGGGCAAADGGVFVTPDIDANPIVWTELGDATEPPSNQLCGLFVGHEAGEPVLYAQTGGCRGTTSFDRMWRFEGTDPAGTWTEITLPTGGFGVFAVQASNPDRLIASGVTVTDAAMFSSSNGGTTWAPMPSLDAAMTGGGDFLMRNRRGPTQFTGLNGYWQPSLVAIEPTGGLMVAGGQDSGIYLSDDDGATWQLVTDPHTPEISGIPHLPRPRYAYFDSEFGGDQVIYIGSQGAGIWRMTLGILFRDGFESGDTAAWDVTVP